MAYGIVAACSSCPSCSCLCYARLASPATLLASGTSSRTRDPACHSTEHSPSGLGFALFFYTMSTTPQYSVLLAHAHTTSARSSKTFNQNQKLPDAVLTFMVR
eukprot:5578640-Amphidinium_carterae.1